MEIGYFALAILGILYYIVLAWYTKRMKSTFSMFWVAFSALHIFLGCIVKTAPDWVDYVILGITVIFWTVFFVVELLILCAMAVVPQKGLSYLVILGAQIRGRGLTGSLKRRLDRGLRYLNENPDTLCIVSGGRGKGEEISEAEAMAEYLEKCGIEKNRIVLEDRSTTTWENLKYSAELIFDLKRDKVGILSNNFHIYRAMKMARIQGYKKVYAIPASTDMVMFPNYMVREFFALFVMLSEMREVHKS